MYFSNGQVEYKGEFVDGKYEGEGTFYIDNGTLLYEGGFRKGVYDGIGTLYNLKTGRKSYEGSYQNGIASGKGIIYRENGQIAYQGELLLGEIDYPIWCNAPLSKVREAFGRESAIEEFSESFFLVYESKKVIFEFLIFSSNKFAFIDQISFFIELSLSFILS